MKPLDISRLLLMAEEARKNAYAPYSGLHVGAALLTADNQIFTGCNIENASFGLTVCAERVALFNAVSTGIREFVALAVISDGEGYCRPCGACRQVIREFGTDTLVVMATKDREYQVKRIVELLPEGFEF